MSNLVVLAVVAAPVIAGLVVHIYRDIRGGKRNRRGCCYACGQPDDDMQRVHHHRGGTYRYCNLCVERHESAKRIAVLCTLAAFLLLMGISVFAGTITNVWLSVLVLGASVAALAAILSLAFRKRS